MSPALAQATFTGPTGGGSSLSSGLGSASILAQGAPPITAPVVAPINITGAERSTTILPTDVLPLPTIQNRMTFGENFQLRVLQKLPARFYFTSSTEVSLRYESNPFQFPTKRRFIRQLGPAFTQFQNLGETDQRAILHQLQLPGAKQQVFRVLPNVTGGFTLTPRTRLFCNYFMIRDSLSRSTRLNTTINSIAYGVQQDIPLGTRANLQAEIQARSLYQAHQRPVFDFLPGLTLSYVVTPRTVAFVNALLQIRGNEYYQAPTRELDPFYTWGFLHQRGGWSFSASTTFVQNFREKFRNAQIKQDNYAFISDFEVARRLFRQIPGIQAFVRAEPIWNFHSRYRPGLAGMDFRLFYGIRMAVSKPALTSALDSLRRQLEEQEVPGPTPGQGPKPSAYVQPHEVVASTPQPIHGFMTTPIASKEADGTTQLLSMHPQLPEVDTSAPSKLPTVALQLDETMPNNSLALVSDEGSRITTDGESTFDSEPSMVPAVYTQPVHATAAPAAKPTTKKPFGVVKHPVAHHHKVAKPASSHPQIGMIIRQPLN